MLNHYRPRALTSFLIALSLIVILVTLGTSLPLMFDSMNVDSKVFPSREQQVERVQNQKKLPIPFPRKGPFLVQGSKALMPPKPIKSKSKQITPEPKVNLVTTYNPSVLTGDVEMGPHLEPGEKHKNTQVNSVQRTPDNFDNTPGTSTKGIRLPTLEAVDLDSSTVRLLLSEHKAHLVAKVSTAYHQHVALLVNLGSRTKITPPRVAPLTERMLSQFSSRGFTLLTDSTMELSTGLLEQKIAQKLGEPIRHVSYRLFLDAGFDRIIADIQLDALAKAESNLTDSHRKHQQVVTQIRLLGPDGVPQVMKVQFDGNPPGN